MKGFITLCVISVIIVDVVWTDDVIDRIIAEVNNNNNKWKAGVNTRFHNAPEEYINSQMGTFLDELGSIEDRGTWPEVELETLPDSYDVRDEYTACKSVSEIRDQGSCGSCWAVAAAEAMSDRLCIKLSEDIRISAVDLLACCTQCGYGCKGGYPIQAWRYWKRDGLVTGGNYNSSEGCRPYPISMCAHHTDNGDYPKCGDIVSTPDCERDCQSDYSVNYWDDKHYGSSYYMLPRNETAIKIEIYARGPVEAAFRVYSDFLTYKSGVYQHTGGEYKGGHAVKLIGWGTSSGVNYWLAANSWNSDWGDNGYFKILRGSNECGIEQNVVAGFADK